MRKSLTPFFAITLCLISATSFSQEAADKKQEPASQSESDKKPKPKPGKDRWLVKTASDPEAKEVDKKPVSTTVEKLLALPRPIDMPLDEPSLFFQDHRARPAETTVYSVEADVVSCQLMPDGDYRVTLKGVSGKTMVLEMPNPEPEFVSPDSPFASEIKTAREQFNGKIQPERTLKDVSGHARINGIGYYGRNYRKQAVVGNLIQLHPVLNIEWMEKPTEEYLHPKPEEAEKPKPKPKPKTSAKPKKPAIKKRHPIS